jgi:OmpA-OmpF porin, OOP family
MRAFVFCGLLLLTLESIAQVMKPESFSLVNSAYDEQNPVLSPDGQTLFFTIANHPQNTAGKRDPGDIWMARWLGNGWSAPIHGGSTLNDGAYNAVAGISHDGNELFLLSHYAAQGSAKSQGIAVSMNNGSGWSSPKNIYIPYFQNRSSFNSGWISSDNRVFVFSAETYGSYGVEDIYVSINENGRWGEPKNLGPVINTKYQELSPWLSEDGNTLYFSTNGRKGVGSFDIFSAKRLDDTWTSWSEPVNVGGNVNTEGRELFYRDFSKLGFALYTTTKDSDGYGDVKIYTYNYTTPVALLPDTLATAALETQPDTVKILRVANPAAKKNVAKVYGTVTSTKSGQPIEARISFSGPQLQESLGTASSTNGYSIEVPAADVYTIRIEAPGFVSALEKLDIHTTEMRELEMNFKLQPVEIGTTVNLKNVLFVQTKTELLPESYDELDMVVSFLKSNPNVKIELSGHTDNRGVHADNVRLSQQRVNTVKDYLVSKGVDAKRINGKGYGGTKPIASNDSEETRRMNRRVEFTIRKF